MEKLIAIIGLMFAYYAIPKDRLIDMKVMIAWVSLLVMMVSHFHSIYSLAGNTGMEFWIRYVGLNLSALGVPVLLGTAYVFKKHLREMLSD
jgi:small neutral amino acid transporter SnatA (MarC family)